MVPALSPPVRRLLLVVCLAAIAVGAGATGVAAQQLQPTDGEFVVELEADGNATVEHVTRYDLTNESGREAFERLDGQAAAQDRAADRFRAAMQTEAEAMRQQVDREVRVGEVEVETERADGGEVGSVTYRFRWEGLAAVNRSSEPAGGDRLVLSLPFSRYDDRDIRYELDRELVVVAPEGYELVSAAPEPGRQNETTAGWPGLTPLDGFEVVAERTDPPADGSTGVGAGFGVGVAVVALVATMLARRRP